jgi:hypothetical protein
VALLAIGITAVVAVTLAGVAEIAGFQETSGDQSSNTPSRHDALTGTVDRIELAQCGVAWHALRKDLAAARPSMDQWKTHIDVMNDLVDGRITLDQASAFWEQTRVDARRLYDEFAAVDRHTDASSCSAAAHPGPATHRLNVCARGVAAARRTLRAARTTLARWSDHIDDMNRLRDGMLSPTMAQQMWLSTWRQGAVELEIYDQRDRALADRHCHA